MTYAVIQTGGKQYKVKASEILKIEKLENSKPESKIEFKEILAYGDDKKIEVGAPLVDGAKVEAELIKNGKNRTVLIFKKRRRKNSRFCIKYDPDNQNLKNKIINIKKNLKNNLPTIPSTIKDELECNIFLRSDNLDIKTKLNFNNYSSLETFSKLRDLKDNF